MWEGVFLVMYVLLDRVSLRVECDGRSSESVLAIKRTLVVRPLMYSTGWLCAPGWHLNRWRHGLSFRLVAYLL